ncbi:MAG: hypothetical protein AVDCRST_MAG50-262, partial [uncultured Acidimicrobiales bacterium]
GRRCSGPVPRAGLRDDHHRGHQRSGGRPTGHRVPAVPVEARHPQGSPRCVDRRGRRGRPCCRAGARAIAPRRARSPGEDRRPRRHRRPGERQDGADLPHPRECSSVRPGRGRPPRRAGHPASAGAGASRPFPCPLQRVAPEPSGARCQRHHPRPCLPRRLRIARRRPALAGRALPDLAHRHAGRPATARI